MRCYFKPSFDLRDAELVVSLDDEPQSLVKIIETLHTDGLPDQAGHAVAPFVVEAFNEVGFSTSFGAGSMLPRGEPFGISFVKIAVDQFSSIACG